jgi:ubiquinone/menaquinone biosynthesis C-methylase UbiE
MAIDKTMIRTVFQDISDRQADSRAKKEAYHIRVLLNRYQNIQNQKPVTLLNVACGLGRHDRWLRELGFTVESIDIDPGFIKIAKKRNPSFKKSYKVGSMVKLPYKSCFFDAALCLFSAFNIPNDNENSKVLKELARVLKSQGLLIMDMQNKNPKKTTVGVHTSKASNGIIKVTKTKFVGNYLVGDETLFVKDKNNNREKIAHELSRERLYTPKELSALCKKNGFSILNFYKAYTLRNLGPKDLQLMLVARRV